MAKPTHVELPKRIQLESPTGFLQAVSRVQPFFVDLDESDVAQIWALVGQHSGDPLGGVVAAQRMDEQLETRRVNIYVVNARPAIRSGLELLESYALGG